MNFVDTYVRSGLYKPPSIPFTTGSGRRGIVSKLGPGYRCSRGRLSGVCDVDGFLCGVRRRSNLVKLASLPDSSTFVAGAAIMLQGMTALSDKQARIR